MRKTLAVAAFVWALCTGSSALAQDAVAPMAAVDETVPSPPGHAAPGFSLPPRDEKGAWITPNRDLADAETAWHLRVALNVAALSCRGEAESQTVTAYNALLTGHGVELASASVGMESLYKARFGAAWQQNHDEDMTKLYNFFAQPPAQEAFCAEARAILHEAAMVEPSNFPFWASDALRRLDAPFTSFYAAFSDYRAAVARYAERHTLAAVVPAPVSPTITSSAAQPPVTIVAVQTVQPRLLGPQE